MSKIIVLHKGVTVEEEADLYRQAYLADDPVDNFVDILFWAFSLGLILIWWWCR